MKLVQRPKEKESRKGFKRFRPIAATIIIPAFVALAFLGKAEARDMAKVLTIQKQADVKRYITKPVDIGADGKIEGMRITVPLPGGGRDTYLVLDVKQEALQELMQAAGTQEKGERLQFIRNWIIQQQRTMLADYTAEEPEEDVDMGRTAPPEERKKATRPPVTANLDASTRPIPPKFAGGNGSKKDPLVMIVPVPVADENLVGTVLYSNEKNPLYMRMEGKGKAYMSCRFMGVAPSGSRPRTTTEQQLFHVVSASLAMNVKKHYDIKKGKEMMDTSILRYVRRIVQRIIQMASNKHQAISDYLSH